MAYISKIKVPGVEAAYLIKDSEGRLMIAPAFDSSKSYVDGDYYVNEGKFYVVRTTESGTTGIETTVGEQLQSIKQSIAGAMHYIGVTSTPLTDGATTETLEPTTKDSLTKRTGFVAGDVVLAPATDKTSTSGEQYYEYVWNGTIWSEFGSTMPIGKMAYANSASGSTSITYNKPVYTGGTVEVNDYSEGESKYFVPTTTSYIAGDYSSTASHVTVKDKYLVTTEIGYAGDSAVEAVTDIITYNKGLVTTNICGVSGTGAAVTGVTSTNKRLAVTEIYGVEGKGTTVSKVTGGSKTINVGATQTTSVVTGLTGATAAAAGNNPFVSATVDADECLSWIEKPLGTTEIREASKQEITVQNLTVEQITGVAKVASDSVTVATGSLVNEGATSNVGDIVSIGVTTTTDSFAKKADAETTVATGELTDGNDIVTEVSFDSRHDLATYEGKMQVAIGRFSDTKGDAGYMFTTDTGDNIAEAIGVEEISGVITKNDIGNVEVLAQGNADDEGAIKVLTGITSTAATKDVTLTKGTDETHSIDVAITVTPDKRS